MDISSKIIAFYKRQKPSMAPVGGVIFLAFMILLILLPLEFDEILGFPPLLPEPVNIFVSLPLYWIGFFLVFWTVTLFFKAKGTPVPFNPPKVLIVTGPYSFCRHPMFLGASVLIFATGILLNSIMLTIVFAPLFAFAGYLQIKKIEEPMLIERFGADYQNYAERVPMFFKKIDLRIPRLPKIALPGFLNRKKKGE